jgi:hypothetical protein
LILQKIVRVAASDGDVLLLPSAVDKFADCFGARGAVDVPALVMPDIYSPALVRVDVTGRPGAVGDYVSHAVSPNWSARAEWLTRSHFANLRVCAAFA